MTPAGRSLSSPIMVSSRASWPSARRYPAAAVRGSPGRCVSRHCEAAVVEAGDQAEPGQQGWMPEIEEIRRRREAALAMGGPQKVARQRAAGRLTVRERIEQLADPGSFTEIGALTGFADYDGEGRLTSVLPANFVAGTA